MQYDIPILIETVKSDDVAEGGSGTVFRIRPLFFDHPPEENKNLDMGLRRLSDTLRRDFDMQVQYKNWSEIGRRLFGAEIDLHRLELTFDIRKYVSRIFVPIAVFDAGDRRIAFCPLLDVPWYEYGRPEELAGRTRDVLREYFRDLARNSGLETLKTVLKPFEHPRHFRLTYLDGSLNTFREPKEQRSSHSNRRRERIDSGKEQIEQVGICLDQLYPKQLDRAIFRDEIIHRVFGIMNDPNPRAVLLVGPPKVGKTAILHSVVARMVEEIKRPDQDPGRRAVWQLTPGRLIAGMSLSGQWETRINAIFAYAEEKELTLHFAQLVGLLHAGKSSQGSFSMADMLLAAMKRKRFRVLCELTEDQLHVLRERNRFLADQFEIVPVPQPDAGTTLRMMLHTMRELEWTWKCSFHPGLLPLALELTQQFENEAALPGKAVQWLANLAVQHEGASISRNDFLRAFADKTGLRLSFFEPGDSDGKPAGKSDDVAFTTFFRERIIGQKKAVAALGDVVLLAESLLTDPKRPIASLFFIGPTGVGKTECAKQLAHYFFGDEKRLLRFDANELCTPAAVARLVGSHQGGDGLLTGAIRRQPFSVILFDEIEKAHPDLFDLLLQVIEEARLTDTLGRVASFSQAIIIFTSNLGTRQAASRPGFQQELADDEHVGKNSGGANETDIVVRNRRKNGQREQREQRRKDREEEQPEEVRALFSVQSHYRKAVEDFFRPEFINRLDRIIPFEFLSREELRRIGERMLDAILSREGLLQRKTCLAITPDARGLLARQQVDATSGARGIRRLIERELIAPLSRFLAANDCRCPTIIEVENRDAQLFLRYVPFRIPPGFSDLEPAPENEADDISHDKTPSRETATVPDRIASLTPDRKRRFLEAVREFLSDLRQDILAKRPRGQLDIASLAVMRPTERLYYQLSENHGELQQELDALLEAEQSKKPRAPLAFTVRHVSCTERRHSVRCFWKRVQADHDLESALDELFKNALPGKEKDRLFPFLKKLAGLHEAVNMIDRPPDRIALLTLSTADRENIPGGVLPGDPSGDGPGDDCVLKHAWEYETLEIPVQGDPVGVEVKNGAMTCTLVRGPGVRECRRFREGTTLFFDGESLSASARLVFEMSSDNNELAGQIASRLNAPAEKWPAVTKIARKNEVRVEEVALNETDLELVTPFREMLDAVGP